ncbi:MAG: AraC family transcriptional regulator [Planctomycetaceae bacterium]|jgi:AraC-like DNA-binding protein|nr:AraC family transcriptional regulator [Planctomycetaceae bacterium]
MVGKTKFYDYLPVGEEELGWGLYVTTLGFNRVLPSETFPSPQHPVTYQFDPTQGRRLPEYQLLFLTQGKGTFSSEKTGRQMLSAGNVLILFPDIWHTYHPDPETGWEDYWIGFNGSYAYELCRRNVFTHEKPLFHPKRLQDLRNAFDRLLELVQSKPTQNSMQYSAITLEILALTIEKEPEIKEELQGKAGIVDEAVRLIWGWSYRVISVDDIADNIGIHRRTLERYFREIRKHSILDEIIYCRLTRARRLLENTRIPIGRIALMAGFTSTQQLRHNFLQFLKKTPEQFRRFS